MELEWDLTLSVLQVGVLEQDLDGKCAEDRGMTEPANPAGEAALLGLGSFGPAPQAMHASLWIGDWRPSHCCLGGSLYLWQCPKSGSHMTRGCK